MVLTAYKQISASIKHSISKNRIFPITNSFQVDMNYDIVFFSTRNALISRNREKTNFALTIAKLAERKS
jgi:hypothetical protein